MKKLTQSLMIFMASILGCQNISNNKPLGTDRIIPDKTPFITGIIEASNDTVFYYPQVTVGYATDAQFATPYFNVHHIPGLFSPTQWTQVVRTIERFELSYEFEDEAEVWIKGPLSHKNEKTVHLKNEGFGVYGDVSNELQLIPGKLYLLNVSLPDGRSYVEDTIIPDSIRIDVPDSIGLNVVYSPYQNGTPFERSISEKKITINPPRQTFLKEYQNNTDADREYLLMEPEDKFLFEDRGDFFRTGIIYSIRVNKNNTDTISKGWWRDIYLKWAREKSYEINWMRFAFYNDGMWKAHQNLDEYVVHREDGWFDMYSRMSSATRNRDSTYLFEVSTIHKAGENGNILPKKDLDAIGFFTGNFSVYKKTVLYPIRNYDIDSVLTANGINYDE